MPPTCNVWLHVSPAQTADFQGKTTEVTAPVGPSAGLRCLSVNHPTERTRWTRVHMFIRNRRVLSDHTLATIPSKKLVQTNPKKHRGRSTMVQMVLCRSPWGLVFLLWLIPGRCSLSVENKRRCPQECKQCLYPQRLTVSLLLLAVKIVLFIFSIFILSPTCINEWSCILNIFIINRQRNFNVVPLIKTCLRYLVFF